MALNSSESAAPLESRSWAMSANGRCDRPCCAWRGRVTSASAEAIARCHSARAGAATHWSPRAPTTRSYTTRCRTAAAAHRLPQRDDKLLEVDLVAPVRVEDREDALREAVPLQVEVVEFASRARSRRSRPCLWLTNCSCKQPPRRGSLQPEALEGRAQRPHGRVLAIYRLDASRNEDCCGTRPRAARASP